jgi:hypothetical protein
VVLVVAEFAKARVGQEHIVHLLEVTGDMLWGLDLSDLMYEHKVQARGAKAAHSVKRCRLLSPATITTWYPLFGVLSDMYVTRMMCAQQRELKAQGFDPVFGSHRALARDSGDSKGVCFDMVLN